ncbi:DUF1501 domain-containing protein [Luteolibacter sp. GHJ8]|uniref:DUF1501 domain-containing protein n=1 Tax=Luteolibacter rhizosphaerae TaxID=2989719 RepID=A0ABT3FYP5_9BACT|nr:DUF1501 domain-containing protein [Luteolibacter rhizosphaerae]MCW1912711.1 DUF1501 domain-containing protein [Luteolibacter rhizosphaerae]
MNRRRFLGQASCSAVSAIPVLNTLLNLRLASSIANAAPPGPGEYRALVCLFLSGGNDSFNMLSPFSGPSSTHGNSRTEYENSRGNLALPLAGLHEIHPLNTPGRTFAVHPSMPKLAARFEAGDAAFVANVGTLIEPVFNRTEVANASKRLPLGLYSHSDQIEQWQTSVPQSRSGVGWGGRMMDLIKDINPSQLVSMNISMDGSNVFQSGITGAEYAVKPSSSATEGGAQALAGYAANYGSSPFTNVASHAVDSMLARQYGHLLQETFQQKRRDSQEAYAIYAEATSGTLPGDVKFRLVNNEVEDTDANRLGQQLHQVAKAIMGRNTIGALRQTFFVNLGGWDHHSETLSQQEGMLKDVDDAIGAFWNQLVLLGIQDQVTLFTASDFGRTLTSNDRGSDHAWGGNHFIMGGSVDGRKIFGQYPSLALNPEIGSELNALDTGRGRMIPTTSCDEYFGELALWLGVPPSSLHLVLPNVGNFFSPGATGPLGFFG